MFNIESKEELDDSDLGLRLIALERAFQMKPATTSTLIRDAQDIYDFLCGVEEEEPEST